MARGVVVSQSFKGKALISFMLRARIVSSCPADLINAKLNLVAAKRDYELSTYDTVRSIRSLSQERFGLKVARYNPKEHYYA